MTGMRWNGSITAQDYHRKPDEKPYVDFNSVTPRYFETFGIPILLGRDFRDDDSPAVFAERPLLGPGSDREPPGPPRVAIVNESFARRYFPGGSAVGKRFSQGEKFDAAKSYEIVGVVGDARYFGLRDPIEPMAYLPQWRTPANRLALCVRASGDPRLLTDAIRRNVERLDSAVPLLRAETLEDLVGENMVPERLVAMLCGLYGLLALLLASVGLYGIMSHAVARRTREIGIRMALGAARAGVLRMVLRDALVLVGAGAVVGIPSAVALGRLVRSQLYGITPQDPFVVVAAVLLLASVTLLASYVPAIRATRIDPVEALRYE
jgi:predicted permease